MVLRTPGVPLLILMFLVASSHVGLSQENATGQLILNIYVDEGGRSLVTGYLEGLQDLSFLGPSQYQYDNQTKQLYALTNSLTGKDGENWTLSFQPGGYYGAFHTIFYLPGGVGLKDIASSKGLEYLVSYTNQSLVVEVQGYDLRDPKVSLKYQQPLETSMVGEPPQSHLPFLIIFFALVLVVIGIWHWKPSLQPAEFVKTRESEVQTPQVVVPLPVEPPLPSSDEEMEADEQDEEPMPAKPMEGEEMGEAVASSSTASVATAKIEVSKEMDAVMQTLTARERSVMEALLAQNGRMTQADIRYETGIPKSSLTGILLSLERRKLIIKKEWGRTNVIELSEWFLSQKERS